MNEFELITAVNRILKSEFGPSELGPGDDAALVAGIEKNQLLVSKDLLIEDVHFAFAYSTPRDVGWKSLAVNHSDICAMGGEIVGYLVGIGVPPARIDCVTEIYEGMKEYLNSFGGKVYGGDVVKSQEFIISVTAIGRSQQAPLKRSGAKLGDTVWVSGELGLSQIGLELLRDSSSHPNISEEAKNNAIRRHRRPIPQLKLANFLAANKIATSMIDISDGLYQDLSHLAQASKKSFGLDLASIPLEVNGLTLSDKLRLFSGGEDFQLAFTVSSDVEKTTILEKFPNSAKIGVVIEEVGEAIVVMDNLKQVNLSEILKSHGLISSKLGYKHF